MPLEQLRPVKRHYCCTADSKCDICSQQPEFCSNYLRNKHIVDSLSCLFRIPQFQVLTTLFRLACDELRPRWHYPRERVWNVMEKVKSPYTEQLDLKIYESMHDRCGQPIDPLDRTNAYKVIRLIFMLPVLVPAHRERLLGMLRRLNSRAICPVNLEGLLLIMGNLRLDRLVFNILEQDARLQRFHLARQFWEMCHLYQELPVPENSAVMHKRRQKKKNAKASTKNRFEQKKPSPLRRSVAVPIFCTRRPMQTGEPLETTIRPEEPIVRSEPNSRRSSLTSQRRSSLSKPLPTAPARTNGTPQWIPASAAGTSHLLPHSTPILGLRSLYLTW